MPKWDAPGLFIWFSLPLFEVSSDRALLEAQQRCGCDYVNRQPDNPVRPRSEWPFHRCSKARCYRILLSCCGCVPSCSSLLPNVTRAIGVLEIGDSWFLHQLVDRRAPV